MARNNTTTKSTPEHKTKAAEIAEQKRFRKRMRQSLYYILVVACAIILTIGEINPKSEFPSWSDMFSQLSDSPQSEPEEYETELSGDILMSVHAIDVGQGDCTLVRIGNITLLIDAGENGMGTVALEYLDDLGIKRLDYVIGTHPHSDHIGGMDQVLEKIDIDCLIIPEVPESMIPTGTSYSDFLDAAFKQREKGMVVKKAEMGTVFELTSYAQLKILSAGKESYADLNDYSIAALITCGDVSFFAAGDITHTAEKDILLSYPDLNADLIKISHHGSDESNSKSFIAAIEPEFAFISCGRHNSYGHPHEAVLDILNESGTKYRRTDIEGTLVYYTDGKIFIEGK